MVSIFDRYLLFVSAEPGDDAEVFEGGGVALDFAGRGEFAEEAAHDFSGACFGERVGEAEVVRPGESADVFGDPLAELLFEIVAGGLAAFEGDEGGDGLSFHLVGAADDGGFRDFWVSDERGFDLHGAEAVAADVDDVVDAAHEPEVPVLIAPCAVAGEVAAGDLAPIGGEEARVIAVDGSGGGRPGFADDQEAAVPVGDGVA